MFLRPKDGFYAGQLREFSPQAGKALLDAGRAVNPFNEIEDAPEPRPPVAKAAPGKPTKKAGKAR